MRDGPGLDRTGALTARRLFGGRPGDRVAESLTPRAVQDPLTRIRILYRVPEVKEFVRHAEVDGLAIRSVEGLDRTANDGCDLAQARDSSNIDGHWRQNSYTPGAQGLSLPNPEQQGIALY